MSFFEKSLAVLQAYPTPRGEPTERDISRQNAFDEAYRYPLIAQPEQVDHELRRFGTCDVTVTGAPHTWLFWPGEGNAFRVMDARG